MSHTPLVKLGEDLPTSEPHTKFLAEFGSKVSMEELKTGLGQLRLGELQAIYDRCLFDIPKSRSYEKTFKNVQQDPAHLAAFYIDTLGANGYLFFHPDFTDESIACLFQRYTLGFRDDDIKYFPHLTLKSSTLFMLDVHGCDGTPLHIDHTQAKNIVLAIGEPGEEFETLWVFIHPLAIDTANELLGNFRFGDYRFEDGIRGASEAHRPNLCDSLELAEAFKAAMETRCQESGLSLVSPVHIIKQCAGEVVSVLVSWMHCVRNFRPCLKIAFDLFDPKRAHLYVQKYLKTTRLLGDRNAKDYIAYVTCMLQLAATWSRAH